MRVQQIRVRDARRFVEQGAARYLPAVPTDADVHSNRREETVASISRQFAGAAVPVMEVTTTRSVARRSSLRPARVADPHHWWRRLCWVTPQLALSGDLPDGDAAKLRALRAWQDAGVTHVVDTRLERNDEQFVARHAPGLGYTWAGVDDDGGRQPDWWFEQGVAAVLEATGAVEGAAAREASSDAVRGGVAGGKVVVHCHMGVNRGPSMGFAAMLASGHDPLRALTTIRDRRPIAAVLYAEDAVTWWHRRRGADRRSLYDDVRAVRSWHRANPIDTGWITSRIWQSGG